MVACWALNHFNPLVLRLVGHTCIPTHVVVSCGTVRHIRSCVMLISEKKESHYGYRTDFTRETIHGLACLHEDDTAIDQAKSSACTALVDFYYASFLCAVIHGVACMQRRNTI